jgi:hypothetical protein
MSLKYENSGAHVVKDFSPDENHRIESQHLLSTWTRIYLHGLIAFVLIFAVAYVVTRLLPFFEFADNPVLAMALSIIAIVVGPPLLGSLTLYGLFPLLGKKQGWRGLLGWDDRLIAEVSDAKEKVRVVIIRWPSDNVRTMGILTSTFLSKKSGKQLAAVYIPTAPQTKLGYIRIVEVDDVEYTDWTLQQWQLYQFTFGSVSPDRVLEVAGE